MVQKQCPLCQQNFGQPHEHYQKCSGFENLKKWGKIIITSEQLQGMKYCFPCDKIYSANTTSHTCPDIPIALVRLHLMDIISYVLCTSPVSSIKVIQNGILKLIYSLCITRKQPLSKVVVSLLECLMKVKSKSDNEDERLEIWKTVIVYHWHMFSRKTNSQSFKQNLKDIQALRFQNLESLTVLTLENLDFNNEDHLNMLKLERPDVTEGKIECTKNTGLQKRLHYHEVTNEETSTQLKKKKKSNQNSEVVSTEWIPTFLLERIRNPEIAKENDASSVAEKSYIPNPYPGAFAQQGGPQNRVNRDPFAFQPANRNLSPFFIEQGMRNEFQNFPRFHPRKSVNLTS
jgi:hypothetical protein